MVEVQQIIEAIEQTLENGWTGGETTVIPGFLGGDPGYIEATYYATSRDKGTGIRIHVEIAEDP